jgi:hypothetical protein
VVDPLEEQRSEDGKRMKRAYKDEQDIVDLASRIDDADVCFYPEESDVAHRFLKSLRSGGLSQRERPDFEDPAASLLLEAMVVDDHPRPGKKDKTRAREGAVLRELKEVGLDVRPDVRVFASVSSGLATDQDHNYRAYIDQFTRTVLNHASKAEVYRAERSGYGLGFLVFDESTAYFETLGAFGPPGMDRPHWWFADSAFVDAMTRSRADCVVWLTPYKSMYTADNGEFPLPTMTIIDVALLSRGEHLVYDARRMVSSQE